MKFFFILMMFMLLSSTNAQYIKGTIYLKNGDSKNGLIKPNYGRIKFKSSENEKPRIYGYNEITGYDLKGNIFEKYRYKKVGSNFPSIMKLIRVGKINLYTTQTYSPNMIINPNDSHSFAMNYGSTVEKYFMEKNNTTIKIGTKINKRNLEFFNDCPTLIQKIKDKEFKKSNVYKIIDYYNSNCY